MRALAVLLVVVAACQSSDDCPHLLLVSSDTPTLFTRGEPYQGRVSVFGSQVCARAKLTVNGSIRDETDTTVDSQWSMDPHYGRLIFDFTPQSGGPFHYVARVEPNLAEVQGDLAEGVPFTGRKLAEVSVPPGIARDGCTDITETGDVICQAGGGAVVVSPDGGERWFEGPVVRAAGPVLWVSGTADRRVERWARTDDGGTWTLRQVALDSGVVALALSETAALVQVEQLVRFELDDAGSFEQTVVPLPQQPRAYLSSLTVDGGAWWSMGSGTCFNPTASGGPPQQCSDFSGVQEVTTLEPEGIWLQDYGSSSSSAISFITEIDGGGVTTITVPGPGARRAPFFNQGIVSAQSAVVTRRDGGLRFEILDGQFLTGHVSARGDKLLVYDRYKSKVTVYER